MVDGSTYPRWKMSCYDKQKLFLESGNTQQANIREQWRHLQLMETHFSIEMSENHYQLKFLFLLQCEDSH